MKNKLYTISQAAQELDITRQAVQYMVSRKLIRVKRIGGKCFISEANIEKYKPRGKNRGKEDGGEFRRGVSNGLQG